MKVLVTEATGGPPLWTRGPAGVGDALPSALLEGSVVCFGPL